MHDLTKISYPPKETTQSDFDYEDYWATTVSGLIKGYELPVPVQNKLDSVIGGFVYRLTRNPNKQVHDLTRKEIEHIAETLDWSGLESLVTLPGIFHHYHQSGGISVQYRVKVDLRVIPTIMNKYGIPINAIAFIAITIETGKYLFDREVECNQRHQLAVTRILGCKRLKPAHGFIGLIENQAVHNCSNKILGQWLMGMRSKSIDTHQLAIEQGHY